MADDAQTEVSLLSRREITKWPKSMGEPVRLGYDDGAVGEEEKKRQIAISEVLLCHRDRAERFVEARSCLKAAVNVSPRLMPLFGVCKPKNVLTPDQRADGLKRCWEVLVLSEMPHDSSNLFSRSFSLLQHDAVQLTGNGILKIVLQVAEVVQDLNEHPCCHKHIPWHGSLCSSNVLTDKDLNVSMVVGVGSLVGATGELSDPAMIHYYKAPEVISLIVDHIPKEGFTARQSTGSDPSEAILLPGDCEKADVYSLGVLMFELLSGKLPFACQNLTLEEFARQRLTVATPLEHCDGGLSNLVAQCMDEAPQARPPLQQLVKTLRKLMVKTYLKHELSRELWMSQFPLVTQVTADELVLGIFQYHKKSIASDPMKCDVYYRALRATVCNLCSHAINSKTCVVRLRDFENIMAYVGPVSNGIFESVYQLVKKTWFHGLLDREAADKLLHDSRPGTFLLRFSASSAGYFALAVSSTRSVKHYRIQHSCSKLGYFFVKRQFDSLDEIVFTAQHDLNLVTPAPGSVLQEALAVPKQNQIAHHYCDFALLAL